MGHQKKSDPLRHEGGVSRGRRATSYDVAQLAGVSQSAVSRALTAGAYISAELKERVLAAAKELGYQPNAMARGLSTAFSRVVAVFIPHIANPIYPFVLQQFSQHLRGHGRQILLLPSVNNANEALECILQYQVDGLIVTAASPLELSRSIVRKCQAANIPVVLFNRYFPDIKASSVNCDNEAGGAQAADLFYAAGHKRIAFVGGPENTSAHLDRKKGFVDRLRSLKIEPPTIVSVPFNYDGGFTAGLDLFNQSARPDAVFCANDMIALGVMDAARCRFGLNVPSDVSVIGFDDVPMSAWASNSLTTFSLPLEAMVEKTVELLISAINGENNKPVSVQISATAKIRGSIRTAVVKAHSPQSD